MGRDEQAVDILASKFDGEGWPLGLDHAKLMNRYQIASDDNYPGRIIVEIERHRSILSAQYTQGLPMSAFETYFMRYAVNVSTSAVQEISERTGGIDIDLDSYVDDELCFEQFSPSIEFEDGHYKVTESVTNQEELIANQDDLVEFLSTFAAPYCDYFSEQLDMHDGLSDDRKKLSFWNNKDRGLSASYAPSENTPGMFSS